MKNDRLKWWLYCAILVLLHIHCAVSQDLHPSVDLVYGPDAYLYNGKKYTFYLPPTTEGHQYLATEEFSPAHVTINGNTFTVENCNYDLYNQQVLMKYTSNSGALTVIELSQAWMDSFSLQGMNFSLITIPGRPRRIYQVIGTGANKVLKHWTRKLSLDMAHSSRAYTFTPVEKESYLVINGQAHNYKNNRGFLAVFEEEQREAIRKYMKQNRINVKKASDMSLSMLMDYCGGLGQ